MTPSPNADKSVILRAKVMLLGTEGPHTFLTVTAMTHDHDNHADGP